jgi:hypothetical protein
LEGLAYEQKEKAKGGLEFMGEEDFEELLMLDNVTSAKSEPLLVPGKNCPGVHSVDHKLVVDFIEVITSTPEFNPPQRRHREPEGPRS